jgi:hypothetical protein
MLPTHEPAPTVEALLAPDYLASIAGTAVLSVERRSLSTVDGLSGGSIERVTVTGREGAQSYVLKRFAYDGDWIMRATRDTGGRASQAWVSGLLNRLPPCIDHAVVGSARDGDGWALLMRDVGAHLIPPGDGPITVGQQRLFLEHMAAMHAAFWEDARWRDARFGFISLREHYLELSPAVGARELRDPNPIPGMIERGWRMLPAVVAPDVVAAVRALFDDPTPLVSALSAFPPTIVHGDWKLGNLGLTDGPEPRTILLDWAVVGVAPPVTDLGWYLAVNSARLPESREATIAAFRDRLARALGARFDAGWWELQLTLGLVGAFLQLGWPKVLGAIEGSPAVQARERAELEWWSARVREGTRQLRGVTAPPY